jgi:uncharacterized protein YbbC (DUF1343 family)
MRSIHWLLGISVVLGCPDPPIPAPAARARELGAGEVRPGIDVLLADSIQLVRGRRVALVTNQTGVDHAGITDIDRLLGAGVHLVSLFSPEHGFRGTADPGAVVASSTDSATGLPIYSLYGATSAPSDAMLAGIDVLLVDLQDAGARYYTYLWTTTEVMRAAARQGIPVVVLDRPNPIGGAVQGNVLDTAYRSAVGLLAIPMRHGMTLGELALLARHDLHLSTRLTVVPAAGWHRAMYFDATGLPFVPPSPNLRSLEALIHYSGLCLLEGTALSVGRGTDHPFEQVGAPGLDTTAVLKALGAARPAGVEFRSVSFTPHSPGDGKYSDTLLAGIRLRVTDRRRYDPPAVAIHLLAVIARSGRVDPFARNGAQLQRLYGAPFPVVRVLTGDDSALVSDWKGRREEFEARRRPYLLYPEN